MKNFKTISTLIFAFLIFANVQLAAQDSCTYRLQLIDSAGDGWDDSQLYLKVGNNPEKAYTHDGRLARPSDSVRLYDLRLKMGDTLTMRYDPQGIYQTEISFTLFNNAGETVVAKGPSPTAGSVYKGAVKCVVCGGALDAKVASIRTFSTTIAWKSSPVSNKPTYRVVWDSVNFSPWVRTPNRGFFETTDTFAILQNLAEVTKYYAYVRSTCVPVTDTSGWVGPLSFITDTATNVGISAITEPFGTCDLGVATVKVKIKNFAGGPKSLIPLKYSVNGVVAPVSQPTDGFYTGVVSKDSTATFTFKARSDFSQPGEYKIAAWTELEKDKNIKNDTFSITITKPRYIQQFPYQQGFENGKDTWSVLDTVGNSTWALGTPRYRFINGAAGGTKAWTTAPDTSYKNQDTSYLLTPCFDFSTFTADPNVSFALNYYSDRNSDGAWLEGSTDGGRTWTRIGSRTTGVNWYTDALNGTNIEAWTGVDKLGWKVAQHPLTGFAGKAQSRLRFGFLSDASFNQNFDGIAIDNFAVSAANAIDLAIDSVGKVDRTDCGNLKDSVTIRIFNLSNAAQNAYSVSYRLDENAVVTENLTISIPSGKSILYKFATPLNTFVNAGSHRINAWVTQASDAVRVNDTSYTTFSIAPPIRGAVAFNFDNGIFPQNWQRLRGSVRIAGHGNASTNGYLTANIFADTAIVDSVLTITPNSQLFDVTTNKFGVIRTADSLTYQYRFVKEVDFLGYDLITNDTFRVLAAEECSNNWVVIDSISKTNHTSTAAYRTRNVALRQFAGKTIKIRFLVNSLINSYTGYFFDLDNVQYKSVCPAGLNLQTVFKNVTAGLNNGEITVLPTRGVAPYTYKWSNDSTRNIITKLPVGNYTVTVTDANGCLDVVTYTINLVSATFDPTSTITKVSLAPNPTTGVSVLNVNFSKITDAKIQVINIMGQVLNEQQSKQSDHAQFDLDLSDKPAGIYLIRITADNKTHVARLLKQ